MRLFNIHSTHLLNDSDRIKKSKAAKMLNLACDKRAVEYIEIDPYKLTYFEDYNLTSNDMLFKNTVGDCSRNAFHYLVNAEVKTIFNNFTLSLVLEENLSAIHNFKHHLNIIPTIFYPHFDDHYLLMKQVEFLGGFPVVFKRSGFSNGVGVSKINSPQELFDYIQFEVKAKSAKPMMRKFIPHQKQIRIIVVGDKVVAAYTNYVNAEVDFRSNVGENERIRKIEHYPDLVKEMAVKSTNSYGVGFGGVDILIEEDTENYYIAEVNAPCAFAPAQELTGIDIAGEILDFLISK